MVLQITMEFDPAMLKKLYRPPADSNGEDNGQVTIIGGSELFHGAPLLALKTASRIVDMVFFSSPDPSVGKVAEQLKSKLLSFIWVPWDETGEYIEKSDAVLVGSGFMRFKSESTPPDGRDGNDIAGKLSKEVTKNLLTKYPEKKWVIDAGGLQVMEKDWIPKGSIITPNKKEYEMLFGNASPGEAAKKYDCVVVLKGVTTIVADSENSININGGNAGMTKGGTGDVQAGLTVALLAKNDRFLAASSAAYIVKAAADELYKKVGTNYNADDLADKIPEVLTGHL